jgi:hypothetical protein
MILCPVLVLSSSDSCDSLVLRNQSASAVRGSPINRFVKRRQEADAAAVHAALPTAHLAPRRFAAASRCRTLAATPPRRPLPPRRRPSPSLRRRTLARRSPQRRRRPRPSRRRLGRRPRPPTTTTRGAAAALTRLPRRSSASAASSRKTVMHL